MQLAERLDEVYRIGGGVGANRVGGTPEEDEACGLVAGWMEDAGLEVERDERGNVIGRLQGEQPELPEVWTGPHLDSVPEGGKFDGPLGVLAGLEAVTAVGRSQRTLGAVVFRDEETGCHGSRWRVEHGSLPGSYVELHIEQGPRLERAGAPLGVVTGAVGTVGVLEVEPGAVNVIPGAVNLTVDARAPDAARLGRLLSDLDVDPEPVVAAAPMAESVRHVLREEVERLGLPVVELPSGAGHDAGVLATAGVETGMLFVRSLNEGVSHSPDEHSSGEDITLAVDVLTATLKRLSSPES